MSDPWKSAPGASSTHNRRVLRTFVSSLLVGALSIGVAWAGAGLVPVGERSDDPVGELVQSVTGGDSTQATNASFDLSEGQLLAGAAKVSLEPRPDDYEGTWEKDKSKCATLAASQDAVEQTATHVADFRVRWAENPNCIYMGGYGIGPMNPIVAWDDEYGLYSRSIAMGDGNDTLVLTLIDAVYWEAYYNSLCEGCGFLELADQLASETGLPSESFMFASTHSHTSPDFIGGWGAVPQWYMQQATDALTDSVRLALNSMRPAVLEAGEVIARQFNGERRDFYRSAEDDGFSWFRLVEATTETPEVCVTPTPEPTEETTPEPTEEPTPEPTDDPTPRPSPTRGPGNGNGNGKPGGDDGGSSPRTAAIEQSSSDGCEDPSPGQAIATVGAYGAHPVTASASAGIADADFPGVFAKRMEESFGGVGMFVQTGLGNLSPRGNKVQMGNGLAALVPAIGAGDQVTDPDVRVARTGWAQPVTNAPLGGLGVAGFFDRRMNEQPATVAEGKGPDNKKCRSASPISVQTTVSAAKIGSLWITGGPGELFANLTNTIEEKNTDGVTMALGLVNDGLGYIVQSFETDHAGRQGSGFVGSADTDLHDHQPGETKHKAGLAEYEDAYSIDHCFGDAVLEKTLRLLSGL